MGFAQGLRPPVSQFVPASPLAEFSVSVTKQDGQRINYIALAGNSLAAFETALEMYGICRISVFPKIKRIK